MAKFRVLTKSFVNNTLYEEGDVVDYDGVPASNLEPLDAPAEELASQFPDSQIADIARQKVAAGGASPDEVSTVAATNAASEAATKVLASQSADGLI